MSLRLSERLIPWFNTYPIWTKLFIVYYPTVRGREKKDEDKWNEKRKFRSLVNIKPIGKILLFLCQHPSVYFWNINEADPPSHAGIITGQSAGLWFSLTYFTAKGVSGEVVSYDVGENKTGPNAGRRRIESKRDRKSSSRKTCTNQYKNVVLW